MKYFDARKHFNGSSKMYRALDKQFDYYIRIGMFANKFHMKKLNHWACSKAADIITANLNLLATNMDLLQTLIANGYVK